MTKPSTQPRPTIGQLGRLIMYWNDLEIKIRALLTSLTSDGGSAEILIGDLETVALFKAARALANDYDERRKRLNTRLTIDADIRKVKVRLYEEVASPINHLIDCADRLREFKEIYVRGTHSVKRGKYPRESNASGTGPHKRYILPNVGIHISQLTVQIAALGKYADVIKRCVKKNENKKARTQVLWPKEFPLPMKLQPKLFRQR